MKWLMQWGLLCETASMAIFCFHAAVQVQPQALNFLKRLAFKIGNACRRKIQTQKHQAELEIQEGANWQDEDFI